MTTNIEAEAATREENNAALIAALDETSLSEVESSWELDVINDAERGRWIATLGAEAIAELPYRFVGGRVVLLTTWVDPAYRHNRVATELVARVLDEIRESGKKITIICPVVGEFIARNPEYLDLIDKVHPGSGAYPQHEPAVAPLGWHRDFADARLRLREWVSACGTRLVKDRPTRQTVWPGEEPAAPIEDIPIIDRDVEFVEFMMADVERRRDAEEAFYRNLDPDTGEVS